ncbi:Transcription factor [Pleurostoma richardsiae]|uniref:Transcription factor n=1 Tax=Pleurostoma richardsiae TaxID=41990 RepID=A0AA38VBM7_9PEZI|nr:Transcription factor [Pleurostoma richardsiae]
MPDDMETNGGEVSDTMSDNDLEYDDSEAPLKYEDDKMTEDNFKSEIGTDGGEVKKKYDPKDPLRPRRKKARRACYACQRAHLTCGDERPCQRCIKRGLAEHCQDGVRKKAKYLHDAPPEALRPVLGPNYNPNASSNRPSTQRHPSSNGSEASSTVNTFFSQSNATTNFPMFSQAQTPVASLPEAMSFASQQSPVSPTFQNTSNGQMNNVTVPQVTGDISNLTSALFDPSNPAIFNFNLEGLNFGSQYGAMEFGMLGHMSSGAAETPPRDPSISQQGSGDVNFGSGLFGNTDNQFNKMYDSNMIGDFLGLDQSSNGLYSQGNLQHGLPHAYAIAAGPTSLQSPSTETNSPQPSNNFTFEGSPTTANYGVGGNNSINPPPRPKPKPSTAPKFGPQSLLGKRQRDPSFIYDTVKEPFPYVAGFHRLIAYLRRRFSGSNLTSIAKALSSIRPSFISCTRTLTQQDLVFMEKCFQRTLFEYEDFMLQCSSPSLVLRRTGEVAAVNKEFTALTGWTKDILLGKAPNLNVNKGGSASLPNRPELATPRLKTLDAEALKATEGKPQPVLLAEMLDDDSVIEFWADYAHLAFGDSRGSVRRKCRLLKYRTQENMDGAASEKSVEESPKDPRSSILSNRVARIDGEHGISKIAKDGKLECAYCWHIRRDTFDMPMMIVMNFLPCYYPNQEPHQLAV